MSEPTTPGRGLTRRRLFGLLGAGTAGVVAGGAAGGAIGRATVDDPAAAAGPRPTDAVEFTGAHQAGIVTPAQDRLHFVAFDVTTDRREDLVEVLQAWTAAARRMTAGQDAGEVGAVAGGPYDVPDDTGEAIGLPASGLTLTVGFGPTLFPAADGTDRFGLAARRPAPLVDLPAFPGDQIDPAISGGDLCIQACANDPQVAVHAIRNLVRIGAGVVSVRWSQLGFGRTSSTSTAQATPRNLFGFKDGTNNLKAEDPAGLDEHVWIKGGAQPWLEGGTYLVARRIRMHIEVWDRTSLNDQETLVGRNKGEGAPLLGGKEFDLANFEAKGEDGQPLIDADAHIRLASAQALGGVKILRRGYNFVDGSDGQGHLNAGLFFLAFMRDPAKQFVPMQSALANNDD